MLLLGEFCVGRITVLRRFNIPAPVVGGLIVSILVLLSGHIEFITKVSQPWFIWLVATRKDFQAATPQTLILPFMIVFFTCVGLNASWNLVKRGGLQVITMLMLGFLLATVQNGVGVVLAKALHVSPFLGLICGSITLTGGPSTALGFAPMLKDAGFDRAAEFGIAAALFGIVTSSLVGGPVSSRLIQKHKLASSSDAARVIVSGDLKKFGILRDLSVLRGYGKDAIAHGLLILLCLKLGAEPTAWLASIGLKFPLYMGAMLIGMALRNIGDATRLFTIKTNIIETYSSIALGFFLAIALMSLNLRQLVGMAVPMLIILAVQVVVMILFAWLLTFRVMGRDYESAVMTGGFIGFGLGITANAVANMKSLVETYGPAPRAFLVVPIVGGFLIDIVNSFNITWFVNLLK